MHNKASFIVDETFDLTNEFSSLCCEFKFFIILHDILNIVIVCLIFKRVINLFINEKFLGEKVYLQDDL